MYKKGSIDTGEFFGKELLLSKCLALFDGLSVGNLECFTIESEKFRQILENVPEFKDFFENIFLESIKKIVNGSQPENVQKQIMITNSEKRRFHKSIDYINTHYTTAMTLNDIARMTGLSRYYFSRMFKREIGHSFKDYLNIKRLEAAKKLLQCSELNISETCYSVGFNDASYFSRLFKRYEGSSPSFFRKQSI